MLAVGHLLAVATIEILVYLSINTMLLCSSASTLGPAVPRLEWASHCRHPKGLVAEVMSVVNRARSGSATGFGPVTAIELLFFAAEAKRLNNIYGVEVTPENMASLLVMETALAAWRCSGRLMAARQKIEEAYRGGSSVLAISAELCLPPTAVLRQVLVVDGSSPKKVNEMIKNPALMPSNLSLEAADVFSSDAGSKYNSLSVTVRSQAFELALVAYLRQQGLRFKTEDEIRALVPSGAPVPPTPDILFDGPVMVNGHMIYWMDAKAYPWYGSLLVAKKITKQANKYNNLFGLGAFVFKGGVGADNYLKSQALLLDGSHIPQ